jgi:ubiquinone/menaquinone biosynthesis C-methylase UbiE
MTGSNPASPSATGSGYDGVDQTTDPQAQVRYLDMVANVVSYKRDALASLNLKPGDHVLDVGCGTGDDCRALAELVGPTGRVVGVDLSATMIDEARRRGGGSEHSAPVEFHVSDIYALPFPDDTFHATRADRVFQHLTDPLAGLAEMQRVTRSGGVVSALDPDYGTVVVDVPNRTVFNKIRNLDLGTCTASQLFGLFHRAGLKNVRVAWTTFLAVTDYALANQLLDLRAWGDEARTAGAITAEEHAEWQETLQALEQTSPFFFGIGAIGIIGAKP